MGWLITAVVVLGIVVLARLIIVEPFSVPSESMEPTLEVGERILAGKWPDAREVHRGDVVVFDGATTFGPVGPTPNALNQVLAATSGHSADSVYVKRVISTGGERVTCCDSGGRLTIDGVALEEPYLMAGEAPSLATFDVWVPPGRLWLMGDHRSRSKDSRSHLGSPGGGTVSAEDVIGPVVFRYWPLDRFGVGVGGP